ncbi:MAG: outer membrane protein transport protein [Gammaproteobacteria bacterium]|nr:outer membrane protein transport protein [Gammaproteobacteria bacterium]
MIQPMRLRLGALFFTLLAAPQFALASGMNLEGLGTRSVSMGGAYIGAVDDVTAVFWNPAGLAKMKGRGFSFGVYSMTPKIWDDDGASNPPLADFDPAVGDVFPAFLPNEPSQFKDEEEFWPLSATMPSLLAYKNFGRFTVAGGAFAVAGAYSDYNDVIINPNDNAEITADIFSLMALVDFNLSVGFQATEKLDIGVGVDILYSNMQSRVSKKYVQPGGDGYTFKSKPSMDGAGVQGNIGFQYDITDRVTMGAVYRTGASFDLKGDVYAGLSGTLSPLGDVEERSKTTSRFNYASSYGVGFAIQTTERLLVTLDYQVTEWGNFNWPSATQEFETEGVLLQDINNDPDWSAADTYRMGFEYDYKPGLKLRGGYSREQAGMPPEFETVTTMTIGDIQYVSFGVGLERKVWTIDLFAGTMWGNNGAGVKHVCLEGGFTLSRQF